MRDGSAAPVKCRKGSARARTLEWISGIVYYVYRLWALGRLVLPLKVSSWMLNRKRGVKVGKSSQECAPCRESLWEDLGPQRWMADRG